VLLVRCPEVWPRQGPVVGDDFGASTRERIQDEQCSICGCQRWQAECDGNERSSISSGSCICSRKAASGVRLLGLQSSSAQECFVRSAETASVSSAIDI
jgi:hypothetical protein